jgi:hypothetical protein
MLASRLLHGSEPRRCPRHHGPGLMGPGRSDQLKIRSWKAWVLGLALAVLTGAAILASQSLDAGALAPAGSADPANLTPDPETGLGR